MAVYFLFSPYLSFYYFCLLIINTVYPKVVFLYISVIFAKCLSLMFFFFCFFTFFKTIETVVITIQFEKFYQKKCEARVKHKMKSLKDVKIRTNEYFYGPNKRENHWTDFQNSFSAR
jgi:hypothetical protein